MTNRMVRLSFSRLAVLGALTASPLVTSTTASAQEQVPPSAPIPPSAPVAPTGPAAPPAPPAAPAPPGTPTTAPIVAYGPRVPTTVDSGTEKHAILERRISTDSAYGRFAFVVPIHLESQKWEQVCVAPCRVDLDRHSLYRVARGNDVTASGEFTLPPESQSLDVKIEPGNLLMHRIGTRLIAAGTAAAIVGGVLITTASKFDEEKDMRLGGIITGAAGIVLLGIGIPLAIVSQTHVKTDGKQLAKASPPKQGPKLTLGGVVF